MAFRTDTLAVLAAMTEEFQDRTSRMIDMSVALVLANNGLTSAVISTNELTGVLRDYTLRREVTSENGNELWRVTLTPYNPAQMEFIF